MAGRIPRGLAVTAVLCGLVTAASFAGAAMLKTRSTGVDNPSTASVSAPATTSGGGRSGCLREPCQVLAQTTVAGTFIDLIADFGATSGRLRIGGSSAGQVIETTITDLGVTLSADSLQCVPGSVSACLIRGTGPNGTTGQIVVGRSDKWSALERAYLSSAGLLVLNNMLGDSSPEVVAAQYDCRADQAGCARRPVYAQVFDLGGQEIGCTRTFPRIEQLPGFPLVQVPAAQLRECP
jgi:hypothetical protein